LERPLEPKIELSIKWNGIEWSAVKKQT